MSDRSKLPINRVDDLKNTIDEFNTEITKLQTNISDVDSKLPNIERNIQDLQTNLEQVNTELTTSKEDITNINNSLTSLTSDVNVLNNELTTVKSDITDLQTSLTVAQGNISNNTNEITILTNELATAKTDINTLETDLSTVNNELTNTKTDLTNLTTTVEQNTQDISSLNEEMKTVLNYSNITNCITKIPQDIKLEISTDGRLVFKTGSKVYIPNGFNEDGSKKFDTVIFTNDAIGGYDTTINHLMCFIDFARQHIFMTNTIFVYSGTTEPTDVIGANSRIFWYDTNANIVKMYAPNETTYTPVSLPLAIVTRPDENTFEIKQVFNGFGYIGKSVYILPGTEVLIPNGRNNDATLKNIVYNPETPQINTLDDDQAAGTKSLLVMNIGMNWSSGGFEEVDKLSLDTAITSRRYYVKPENKMYWFVLGNFSEQITASVGELQYDGTRITSLTYKLPIRLPDIQDYSFDNILEYNTVSNCITKLPQNVILEYTSNKTINIKAGTKLYIPDGFEVDGTTRKFKTIVLNQQKNKANANTGEKGYIFYDANSNVLEFRHRQFAATTAGATTPTSSTYQSLCHYNTATNLIGVSDDYGATWTWGMSLPICVVTGETGTTYSSVDQIFNGFGYIASVAFVLPGVEYLIPNGRNNDGSLNNIKTIVEKPDVHLFENEYSNYMFLNSEGKILSWGGYYSEANNATVAIDTTPLTWFDVKNNLMKEKVSNTSDWINVNKAFVGKLSKINGLDSCPINNIEPKQPLEIPDKNSKQFNELLNYNSISNCITKIPQDIKLSLSAGTLTLKAGSKLYYPNGFNSDGRQRFDVVYINNDIVRTKADTPYDSDNSLVIYSPQRNYIDVFDYTIYYTQNTAPSNTGTTSIIWYDLTENKIKVSSDSGTSWIENVYFCLPFAQTSLTVADGFTEILEIFNGFGIIGQAGFILPGVEGLIPNGRNSDGSLNNIQIYQYYPLIVPHPSLPATFNLLTFDFQPRYISYWNVESVYNVEHLPTFLTAGKFYVTSTNEMWYYDGTSNMLDYARYYEIINACVVESDNGRFKRLYIKKPVTHLLDMGETDYIAEQAFPSGRYFDLTLGASGTTYAMPGNGYLTFAMRSTAAGQYMNFETVGNNNWILEEASSQANDLITLVMPVTKRQQVIVRYTLAGVVQKFRFIYAKGIL